jgi:hypothetical protein
VSGTGINVADDALHNFAVIVLALGAVPAFGLFPLGGKRKRAVFAHKVEFRLTRLRQLLVIDGLTALLLLGSLLNHTVRRHGRGITLANPYRLASPASGGHFMAVGSLRDHAKFRSGANECTARSLDHAVSVRAQRGLRGSSFGQLVSELVRAPL